MVDALGLGGQLLDTMLAGQTPPEAEKPRRDSWDLAFERAARDSYGEARSWRVV